MARPLWAKLIMMFQDLMQLNTVKAISLWQPWATLAAMGAKSIETRSWYTPYRGLLLIHAAKRWTGDEVSVCGSEPFRTLLKGLGFTALEQIPLGRMLGVVTLKDVCRTEAGDIPYNLSEQEYALGDYSCNRFAWQLINPRPFPKPFLYRGRQGLFDVPVSDICPYLQLEAVA